MPMKALLATRYLTEKDQKSLLHRIRRLKGHADSVARMIESGECVDVILMQVAALKGAVDQLGVELARQHLAACATRCMPGTQEEIIGRVIRSLAALL